MSRTLSGRKVLIPRHHELENHIELVSGLPIDTFVDSTDTTVWKTARNQPSSLARANIGWILLLDDFEVPAIPKFLRDTRSRLCYRLPLGPSRFGQWPTMQIYG